MKHADLEILKHCQTVKQINKQKTKYSTCFHVIPYIDSPVTELFLHILMATMSTFTDASLIIKKDKLS